MIRAVSRGIDNVEELERVEHEEAERDARRVEEQRPPASSGLFSNVDLDPVFLPDDVALSPSFFIGMGVSGPLDSPGGTSLIAVGNSSNAQRVPMYFLRYRIPST